MGVVTNGNQLVCRRCTFVVYYTICASLYLRWNSVRIIFGMTTKVDDKAKLMISQKLT